MHVLLTACPKFDLYGSAHVDDVDFYKKSLLPPLAIYQLAAAVDEDHRVRVLDPAINDFRAPDGDRIRIRDQSKLVSLRFPALERCLGGVDCVGISASSFDWFLARVMARRIKEIDPDLPVIAGGIHPTLADRHILESSEVDYIVRGEGEKTLPDLLSALDRRADLGSIAGVSFRRDGEVKRNKDKLPLTIEELEATPLPALDLMPSNIYGKITVETSRGCWNDCSFCSILYHRRWRGVSPEVALRRIEHASEYRGRLYGDEKMINIIDDNFTADVKRSERILRGLKDLDLAGLGFAFEGRAGDLARSDIIRASRDLPMDYIYVGVEAGYQVGLKTIKKHITLEDAERCAALAKEHGVIMHYGFIAGFPWETREDCLRTVAFADKLVCNYGGFAFVNWFHLFPGSRIWEDRARYGITEGLSLYDGLYNRSGDFMQRMLMNLTEEDVLEIEREIDKRNLMRFIIAEENRNSIESRNTERGSASEAGGSAAGSEKISRHSAYTKEGSYCLNRTGAFLQGFIMYGSDTELRFVNPI